MQPPKPLVELRNVSCTRGDCTLRNFDWSIRAGEVWVLTGDSGSGKTTLLEFLAGRLRVDAGTITYELPKTSVQFVGFREQSRAFSYTGHYYQQRYEFADSDEPLNLREFLGASSNDETHRIAAEFGLADLLDLGFVKLSNGQTRRARIAKAVLAKPSLLLLDDPFVGLDTAGRAMLSHVLQGLSERGIAVVLTALADERPDWARRIELTKRETTSAATRSGRAAPSQPDRRGRVPAL